MAKKAKNVMVEEKKEKVLDFVLGVIENQSKNIVEFVKKVTKVREKVRKLVVATGLTLAGLVVILVGLSNYLSTLFPNLQNGIMQIIVGLVAIIVAVIYEKV